MANEDIMSLVDLSALKMSFDESEDRRHDLIKDLVAGSNFTPSTALERVIYYFFGKPARRDNESDGEFRKRVNAERTHYQRDATAFWSQFSVMPATYFGTDGERINLGPENAAYKIDQRFGFSLDNHIPHFHMYVAARVASTDNIGCDSQDESGPDEHQLEPMDPLEPSLDPEKLKGQSIRNSVHAMCHYEAFVDGKCMTIDDAKDSMLHADSHTLPTTVKTHIKEMLADGAHPHVIMLDINVDNLACLRVFGDSMPIWAGTWCDLMRKGKILVVVDSRYNVRHAFHVLKELLQQYEAEGSPMDQFYCSFEQHDISRFTLTDDVRAKEEYGYRPKTFFYSADEWLTVHAVQLIQELHADEKEADAYGDLSFQLRMAKVGKSSDRAYLAWLPVDDDEELGRLPRGTKIYVKFKSEWNTSRPEKWAAEVAADGFTVGRTEYVALTMSRPSDPEFETYSSQPVRTLDTKGLDRLTTQRAIAEDRGNKVEVTIVQQTTVADTQLSAMESLLNPPLDRPLTAWNNTVLRAALGSRHDKLENIDIFKNVRGEFPDVTTVMELNTRQRQAVLGMQDVKTFVPIQGPPGTGKTATALQIMKPFLMSKTDHQILYITATNKAVDGAAQKVRSLLDSLRAQGKLNREGYAIRLYASGAEKQVRSSSAGSRRHKKLADITKDDLGRDLDEVTKIFTRQYHEETKSNHTGRYKHVSDKRVTLPEMSVAAKMLEVIGIIEGLHTDPDEQRWARARSAFNTYVSDMANEEKREDFSLEIEKATNHVIKHAKVIVTTTASAGMPRLLAAIEPTVEVIIADESPRERELSYMPLFAARFAKLQGFIMLGDWLQLRPLVIRSATEFIFAKQGDVAFMPRLVANGIRAFELTEQHRMNEGLCDMINLLTYANKLTTHQSALFSNRPMSRLFSNFVHGFTGKHHVKLLINVPDCDANFTLKSKSSSRYNEFYINIAISIAKQLLELDPSATVAMLSGYTAHKDRLRQARDSLRQSEPGLFKENANRLVAETVDAVQGEEYDFTIGAILSDGRSIGHQADPRRANVLDSRAKNGYVLIATLSDLEDRREQDDYVGRLIDYLKPFRYD